MRTDVSEYEFCVALTLTNIVVRVEPPPVIVVGNVFEVCQVTIASAGIDKQWVLLNIPTPASISSTIESGSVSTSGDTGGCGEQS